MDKETRDSILDEMKRKEEIIKNKEKMLKEIKVLVNELKESSIVNDLKQFGEAYKFYLQEEQESEKILKKIVERSERVCIHPILCRMGYQRHIDKSARLYKTDRENALHAKNKCIECGKVVYSKDRDDSADWDSYIIAPISAGQTLDGYVKRVIVEPTVRCSYSDLREYYHEIMLDNTEREAIKLVKEKVKKS